MLQKSREGEFHSSLHLVYFVSFITNIKTEMIPQVHARTSQTKGVPLLYKKVRLEQFSASSTLPESKPKDELLGCSRLKRTSYSPISEIAVRRRRLPDRLYPFRFLVLPPAKQSQFPHSNKMICSQHFILNGKTGGISPFKRSAALFQCCAETPVLSWVNLFNRLCFFG